MATIKKYEFDAAVGGEVDLSDTLQTYKYAAERVVEIKSLIQAIQNPSQTKLVFQTLPTHMRRRAMSHHPKRLPRKHRQAHIAQMRKSGVATQTKRPSRKFRRKPNNLMKEYTRRQQTNIWLETHIWHSKRFHMKNTWGYKLAQSSCDKTYRSSYRATAKHCLMQDISYHGCIELTGPVDHIRNKFKTITNLTDTLSICAKVYLNGNREGSLDLYKQNSYPLGAFGSVNFIWKPDTLSPSIRTLWLFVHPSFYRNIVNEFIDIFQLKLTIPDDSSILNAPIYCNDSVILTELKDQLNRFRLTGPLSHAVLSSAFKCKAATGDSSWFKNFLEHNENAHTNQSTYWSSIKSLNSPAELPPNIVLALNIEDPRINRPKKRSKAIPENNDFNSVFIKGFVAEIPMNSQSALWEKDARKELLEKKMPTYQYCSERNKHALVPGEPCLFEENMQPVPVILIQRPGCQESAFKKLGYGSGWDVIVPTGYGLSTWMSLIMWGAKAGGLREIETINRESGTDEFLPDTLAAKAISDQHYIEQRNEYFKKPQNKRPNYNKLSIVSPFQCPWPILMKEWTHPPTTELYVLRNRDALSKLQQILDKRLPYTSLNVPKNCLIPIYLKMESRGNPGNNAIITIPTHSDLKRCQIRKRNLNNAPIFIEPLKEDNNEKERKRLRSTHIKLLKRLRRRRVRVKKIQQETADKKVVIAKPRTASLVAKQLHKMRELWLPTEIETIRNQCAREVIGYVTHGDFSFSEATGAAVGYVTLIGLKKLIEMCGKLKNNCKVLVRSTDTRNYRFATFKVKI